MAGFQEAGFQEAGIQKQALQKQVLQKQDLQKLVLQMTGKERLWIRIIPTYFGVKTGATTPVGQMISGRG